MYNVDLVNPLMDNQYNSSISHNDNLMGSFSGTLHPFQSDEFHFRKYLYTDLFQYQLMILSIAEPLPEITATITSVTEFWISVMPETIVS